MSFNINIKISAVVILSMILTACHNHKEGDGHNHGTTETKTEAKTEEHHEEAPSTIASLTDEQIKTVGITYVSVEMKELTATIKANGNLKVPNNNKGNATSLYGGVIKSLNVQIGSYVRKGQVIATIANPQFIQLQEEYLTIASKIIFAEQELARQKELNEGNAGAKKNLQSATADLNSLRTRRASLQQQIQLMGINPNNVSNGNLQSMLVVSSPISGTVSNVFAKIGSYVDVSSPVAEIVDNGSLHLDLNVFEKDLPMLKVGQTIHFTLTNNPTTEYDAVVYSIGTAFESDSKTIPVHCNVKGNKTGLIDGMNITAIVSLNNVTSPAVPTEAIVEADGKYYIFIKTNKEPEEHHEEGEEGHDHNEAEKGKEAEPKNTTNFEKIEIVKGVSNMGYTAITFVNEIPKDAVIVTKGAFFINAKLSNTGEHEH
jgi:RND family efflux transporter MFP subunit